MSSFQCYTLTFSSRRRHTRSDRDWSSDVCSSDLTLFLSQAEDGIRDLIVTGVQTCALLISSRRRHTRSDRDWSSDVCSSDLNAALAVMQRGQVIESARELWRVELLGECHTRLEVGDAGSLAPSKGRAEIVQRVDTYVGKIQLLGHLESARRVLDRPIVLGGEHGVTRRLTQDPRLRARGRQRPDELECVLQTPPHLFALAPVPGRLGADRLR